MSVLNYINEISILMVIFRHIWVSWSHHCFSSTLLLETFWDKWYGSFLPERCHELRLVQIQQAVSVHLQQGKIHTNNQMLIGHCGQEYTDRHGSAGTGTHTHIHMFSGHLSGTTWVSQYPKCKTNLDFTEARESEWQ